MATRLRPLLGLLLTGYGLLVLARVLAHESLIAGTLSLACGLALLAGSVPQLSLRRAKLVAGLGLAIVACVAGYNLATGSGLGAPEWALLVYGAGLVALSPLLSRRVGKTDVGSIVAWSLPILLAPLAMFSLNATLSSPQAGTAASPLVLWLIVIPTLLCLRAMQMDVTLLGKSLVIPTERGVLSLDVGLVCAGLYPMVLFGAIVALHAWREGLRPRQVVGLVSAGLLTLWTLNLVRLVALTQVGARYGATALQQAHAHLGWLLFAAFMVVFWHLALRPRTKGAPVSVQAPVEAQTSQTF